MVSQRKILINSPIINELCFDYLFGITAADRKKFSPKEIRAIKTAKKARRYVSKATLDEKLLTLAKLGVQFSFILHNKNPLDTKEIKQRYEKYKAMSKIKAVAEMTQERFVVLSDRILINFLNVMGSVTHSETYLLNMDFHKVGGTINNWKDYNRPNMDGIQESLEYAKIINRYTLNVSKAIQTVKGDYSLADLDLNLLMYLFDKQGSYVPRQALELYFMGIYRKTVFTAAIKRLQEKVFIERNPEWATKYEYQITGLGCSAVMDFHRHNLAQTI